MRTQGAGGCDVVKGPLPPARQGSWSCFHLQCLAENGEHSTIPCLKSYSASPCVIFGKAVRAELLTFLGYCFVSVLCCPCYPKGWGIISLLGGTVLLSWLFQPAALGASGCLLPQPILHAARASCCFGGDLLPFRFQISILSTKRERTFLRRI